MPFYAGQFNLTGNLIEVRHAVANFINRREKLPTETHVQSQIAGDAPIVLKVRADRAVALSNGSRKSLAVCHVGRQAEKKIRFGVAGVLAAEADLPGRAVGAGRWNIVVAVTLELKPGVHGVRAVDHGDVIFERNGGLMENLGSIHGSESEGSILRSANRRTGEIQTRKERRRLAGNQACSSGASLALYVAFSGEIVCARAEFVDDGRAESPGVIDHAALQRENIVSSAVVEQRLAVDGGLRDVLLRVAREDVVLVGRVPIHLGVALIAVGVGVLRVRSNCFAYRCWCREDSVSEGRREFSAPSD